MGRFIDAIRKERPGYASMLALVAGCENRGAGASHETRDGLRFIEAAVGASDHDVTYNGVKLYASDPWQLNARQFGAAGDGSTDDTSAIQSAIDAANAKAVALGEQVELFFPRGDFCVTDSLELKDRVFICGSGRIRRQNNTSATGSAFSIFTADGVSDWSVRGVTLENVPHSRVASEDVSTSSVFGAGNNIFDIRDCADFDISGARLKRFSKAIRLDGCTDFAIRDNFIRAISGKTVDEMIAGTFTQFAAYTNTGAIDLGGQASGTVLSPCSGYQISRNQIDVAGLDVGIWALALVWDRSPGTVSENHVQGGNAGIQVYRGSLSDPGSANTYESGVQVIGNNVEYTWQQGIYLRGVIGGQVISNRIYRSGMGGDNGSGAGNTACGIIARVDPFTNDFTSADDGDVSNDHPMLISLNQIIDHGHATSTSNEAVSIEVSNVEFVLNTITRSAEFSTTAVATAVAIGGGSGARNVQANDNAILGVWNTGISATRTTGSVSTLEDSPSLSRNRFVGSFVNGIYIDWNGFNMQADHNRFSGAYSGSAVIVLRGCPWASISYNDFYSAVLNTSTHAIEIRNGCLASQQAYYMTGQSVGRTVRRGGTVRVIGNDIFGFSDPFGITEGNGSDASFYGRCRDFKENTVNGRKYVQEYSGGTPSSSSNAKTWHKHEVAPNSSVAAAAIPGKICTSPGTYGASTTTTGDTTSGSAVISNVGDLDGYGVGIYLNPSAGFSGPVLIISIDPENDTITVDQNAGSDNTGATLTVATPTFASMAALA